MATTSAVTKNIYTSRDDLYKTESTLKAVVKVTKTSQCHYMMEVGYYLDISTFEAKKQKNKNNKKKLHAIS